MIRFTGELIGAEEEACTKPKPGQMAAMSLLEKQEACQDVFIREEKGEREKGCCRNERQIQTSALFTAGILHWCS